MTKTDAKPAASADDLLKAAVDGKPNRTGESEPEAAVVGSRLSASVVPPWLRETRVLGAVAATLAIGTAFGAGVAALSIPSRGSNDTVAVLGATLDAARIETGRLSGEVAHLHQVLAELKTTTESARKDAATRGNALGERLAQVDRSVGAKLTALGERVEQSERDQTTRIAGLATQLDRRATAVAAVARVEPMQTGSLSDAKAGDAKVADAKSPDAKPRTPADKPTADKPTVIDGWAVRDVFNGAAILENRRRRIVEVGPGDTLPGVGRVEAVERRGHDWVVVTRQGVITAQPW